MWSIHKIFEANIHIPDVSSEFYHCSALNSPFDPLPEKFVQTPPMHPTIQFTNADMGFFKYPNIHIKAQWVDLSKKLNGVAAERLSNGRVLWDAYYQMPPKLSIPNMKQGRIVWSNLDWSANMLKNVLKPGGTDWVHMKRLCVPPDGVTRRIMVTATPADSDNVDVLDGPTGIAVYSVKHWTYFPYIHQLNKGVAFL
jgi:hypothetical protein